MNRSRLVIAVVTLFFLSSASIIYLVSIGFWNQRVQSPPDIILHNGEILTMEETPSQAEAIAIRNGTIVAVGDENEIMALGGTNTSIIDLRGKTIVPGFIDSHTHDLGDRNLTNNTTPEDAIERLLRSGWTSISEMFVDQGRLDDLRTLDEQGKLRVRVNAYLPLGYQFDRFGDWYKEYEPNQEFSSKVRIGGVKLFMDGSYVHPVHYFNQTELNQLVQEAHDAGFQVAIHSIVDNSTDIVLDVLESVLDNEPNSLYRHRIEHLVFLRDDQIERMSELGIIASFQLSWFTSDWRGAGSLPILNANSHLVARWHDIVESGVPAIGSTDYPWNQYDIRAVPKILSFAVTRVGDQGLAPLSWMEEQTLSIEQALRLLTIDAAYGTSQEDIKGSIKAGKLADLVVLSDNPLTVSSDELDEIEVMMTMIGGVIEYSSPEFQSMTNNHNSYVDQLNAESNILKTDISQSNSQMSTIVANIQTCGIPKSFFVRMER